jgi:hypothetical protein
VVQEATTGASDGAWGVSVTTRLLHSSGQWIQFEPLSVPMSKADAHGVGSATTYARRYALGAALGLVAEDDDANHATQQPAKAAEPVQTAIPANFGQWWADMQAVADNGLKALQEAWKASSPALQKYVQESHKAQWEKLKAKASAQKELVAQ